MVMAASLSEPEVTVFAANLSDGGVRRLVSRTWSTIRSVTWLPDGNGLAMVATENNSINPQLWYISYPSGEARRLTTDLSFYGLIAVSGNGSILSAEGKNQSNIWIAPSGDLAAAKQITFGSPGQDDGWSGLNWTNDGRIVYTADTDNGTNIWLMDADGKNRRQVIPSGGVNSKPSVTDDGRFLVFQSNRGGHWAVWRSELDGNNLTQLTGDAIAGEPDVSRDGKWIIYENNYDGAGELWRMSIDGQGAMKLTDHTAEWPEISPDGKFVACGLYFGKDVKLAILPIDGGEPVKLFDLPRLFNLRWGVRWTPDQKALTYRDWSNGIWKQSLDGDLPPERLNGLPEEKLAAYGWSSDGSKLAFSRLNVPRDVILIKDASAY